MQTVTGICRGGSDTAARGQANSKRQRRDDKRVGEDGEVAPVGGANDLLQGQRRLAVRSEDDVAAQGGRSKHVISTSYSSIIVRARARG